MVAQPFDAQTSHAAVGTPGRAAQGRLGAHLSPASLRLGNQKGQTLRARVRVSDANHLLGTGTAACGVFGIGLSSAAVARLSTHELAIHSVGPGNVVLELLDGQRGLLDTLHVRSVEQAKAMAVACFPGQVLDWHSA
jgi:hypothetical protein